MGSNNSVQAVVTGSACGLFFTFCVNKLEANSDNRSDLRNMEAVSASDWEGGATYDVAAEIALMEIMFVVVAAVLGWAACSYLFTKTGTPSAEQYADAAGKYQVAQRAFP